MNNETLLLQKNQNWKEELIPGLHLLWPGHGYAQEWQRHLIAMDQMHPAGLGFFSPLSSDRTSIILWRTPCFRSKNWICNCPAFRVRVASLLRSAQRVCLALGESSESSCWCSSIYIYSTGGSSWDVAGFSGLSCPVFFSSPYSCLLVRYVLRQGPHNPMIHWWWQPSLRVDNNPCRSSALETHGVS